jgi:hypothetical protein
MRTSNGKVSIKSRRSCSVVVHNNFVNVTACSSAVSVVSTILCIGGFLVSGLSIVGICLQPTDEVVTVILGFSQSMAMWPACSMSNLTECDANFFTFGFELFNVIEYHPIHSVHLQDHAFAHTCRSS